MNDEVSLLGRGVSFPPRLGADGRVAWSTASQNVRESIRVILGTDPAERVMLPEFGAGLRAFLYEPNNAATHRLIEDRVAQALQRWEPRIRVDRIDVSADPIDRQQANVTITYRLVATGEQARIGLATTVER
ncbi:MAG: phage tail protein [Rhodococcus sp. (in: high G+C Gram-positive bacteria)]|nr:MAG: phage tail protein [Rhodococcus sp. (in: high G+C Gram-positive bacteria)]